MIFAAAILLLALASYAYAARVIASDDPSSLYFYLGKESFGNNEFDNAIYYFEKAISFDKDSPEAHHNLALSYYRLGEKEKAISELQEAISLKENYAKAYYSLGLIYFKEKQYEDAAKSLLKVTEIEPENTNARFDLAVSYAEIFRSSESTGRISSQDINYLHKSLSHYEKVLSADPDFPNALSNSEIIRSVIDYYAP